MHTVSCSCKIDENDKKQVQAPSYEQIIRSRLKEAYYENLKRSLGRN